MAMNKETSDYYDSLFELFSTQGWKNFILDNQEALDSLIEHAHIQCHDNDSWQVRRGEISQLMRLVNYEDFIRASFKQIEQETDGFHTDQDFFH